MIIKLISKTEGNRLTHLLESIKSFGILITDYLNSQVIRQKNQRAVILPEER